MESVIVNRTQRSLPHRQLRKFIKYMKGALKSSLPHRQLRKDALIFTKPAVCSLPHRQLRKRSYNNVLLP